MEPGVDAALEQQVAHAPPPFSPTYNPESQMILDQDREAITRLAEHYSITRLLLFGSSTDPTREGRDIDLAVEGLPPQDFFRFYGDLLFSVSKPVDLVDLAQNSKLTRHIRREGLSLYEAT